MSQWLARSGHPARACRAARLWLPNAPASAARSTGGRDRNRRNRMRSRRPAARAGGSQRNEPALPLSRTAPDPDKRRRRHRFSFLVFESSDGDTGVLDQLVVGVARRDKAGVMLWHYGSGLLIRDCSENILYL